MRRALLPATAALAALTAVALCGAAYTVRPPALPAVAEGQPEAGNRAIVSAFYEAVNAAIATGDLAPFEAVVAPGFVERDAGAGADRDGLARRLLAIRAAAPSLRLGVEDLAADGDVVIAHVRVVGAASAAFLGLPLKANWTGWGPVDVFRLEAGRIVERWGAAADPVPPPPALQVTFDVPPPETRSLTVARLTLAPGAGYAAARQSGPRLLLADIGAITVAPAAVSGADAAPPTALRAGEHVLLPTGTGFTVQNTGRSSAALLDIALLARPYADSPPEPTAPPSAEGVTVHLMADDLLIAVPSSPAILAIGRLTLGPGEGFGWLAAAGPVLLHVEAGTLDLAATGSVPWILSIANKRTGVGSEATMATGGGALLEAGAAAEIRAALAAPATVLVVTLLPANESGPGDHPPPA